MYVDKLEIKNFKCFEETAFELNYPGRETKSGSPLPSRLPNVNLFLGDNGTGKSSVFKALTLAVLAPILQSSGFTADFLVRRLQSNASLRRDESLDDEANVRASLKLHNADVDDKELVGHLKIMTLSITRRGDFESIAVLASPPGKTYCSSMVCLPFSSSAMAQTGVQRGQRVIVRIYGYRAFSA